MSVPDTDLEDEIPANRIISISSNDMLQNESFFAESNNFVEIIEEDGIEEVVEYIEYSDDEKNMVEECPSDEQINSTEDGYIDERDVIIKMEPVDGEEELPNQDEATELYHCSSCDTNFHSVVDHINEFHKDQSVLVDTGDKDLPTSIETTTIKSEESNVLENTPYTHMLEDSKSKKIEMISEEKCFDSSGRPYMRKKLRVFDVGLPNISETHKCENCLGTYNTIVDLEKHICEVLKKSNSSPNNNTFLQYFINKQINPVKELKYGSEAKVYACPECDTLFQTHRSLSAHLKVHKNESKANTPESEARCDVCNTIFPTMKSLKLHRRMHDPIKSKAIEEAVGYELKSVSRDGTPKETFFCELCNKSYDKMFQEVHKKAHKSGPKLICQICNKKFSSKVNLGMHMKIHKEQTKPKPTKAEAFGITLPYECSYCGRQFARPHEKVKHERIHTGEKPYKCEICGKSFRVSYCLTLHLRTHTGARPYVCAHCNKRFKAYSVYNHHLMTHSEDRPYKCPYCPKAFKTTVQLGGHKNSHTKPFSCPECNRPFASLYAVKAHMETHKKGSTNLKHRCGICGAIYARIFALRLHMGEQHQTSLNEDAEPSDVVISDGAILESENRTSTQSIIPDNEDEITVGDLEHFQTEEVVTDWLK